MADSGAIEAGRAFVRLMTDDSQLVKGLANAQKKFSAWGRSISALGKQMLGAGLAIGGPLLGAAAAFAKMGAEMERASQITGVSVESLSALGYAAQQSGVEMEALQGAMIKMDKAVVAAQGGSEKQIIALRRLGLSAGQLKSMKPEDQFKLLADRISKVENPAQKAALAMEVFGKSGAELLPLLNRGGPGIDALTKHAADLGIVMSGPAAEAAEEFDHQLTDLEDVAKMAVLTIGGALAPVLRVVTMNFVSGVKAVTEFVKTHQGLVVGVAAGAAALVAGGAALVAFGTAFGTLATIIGGILTPIGMLGSGLLFLLTPIGAITAGILIAGAALVYFTNIGNSIKGYLGPVFTGLAADTTEAFGGILDAMKSGDWATAAKILWTYVQLEFQKGKAAVLGLWISFKAGVLEVWYDCLGALETGVSYLQEIFSTGWIGLKSAAMSFMAWLTNAWRGACNFMADIIQETFLASSKSALKEAMADIDAKEKSRKLDHGTADKARAAAQKTFGEGTDVTGKSSRDSARKADYDASMKSIDAEYQAALKAAEAKGKGTRAAIEMEREAQVARVRAELEAAKAAGNVGAGKIADLTAQLKGLTGRAASAGPAASPFQTPDFDKTGAAAGASDMASKMGSVGTFNASAAFGLVDSGPMNKVAKATADTAANTKRIADSVAHGGGRINDQGVYVK